MSDIAPPGWTPVDVGAVLAGGVTVDPPDLLHRADGRALLYRGRVHAVNGEPSAGKSWVEMVAAAQHLGDRGQVIYIDHEDSDVGVLGRMLALRVTADVLAERFTYVNPTEPVDLGNVEVLDTLVVNPEDTLVVIDGVTESLSLHGLNPNDNAEVARWGRIPRRFAERRSTVVISDHVVKAKEERGRWAIGAQHKLALIDGAAYSLEVIRPFARGHDGAAKLVCAKDRHGYWRRGEVVAELHLSSDEQMVTTDVVVPEGASGGPFRPTHLMERVSRVLEDGAALSGNSIRAAVKGKGSAITYALELLISEGYITTEPGDRGARLHCSFKPYREEMG